MKIHEEYQYLDLCKKILAEGTLKGDRTGTGTYSIFGHQMRFNLSETFPLLTTKSTAFRLIVIELLWFLKGETNIQELVQNNVHIWNDWPFESWFTSPEYDGELDSTNWKEKYLSDEEFQKAFSAEKKRFAEKVASDDEFAAAWGELGPVYGKQWRSWATTTGGTIDQLKGVIESLKNNPNSRRHLVSAWNPEFIDDMALPPCHTMFQFYVADGKLSCQLYQRSADVFLGVPFNIASYALLTLLMARATGLEPGEFVHTFGDTHIYTNHVEQVNTQLTREPLPFPTVELNPEITDIFDFKLEDIVLKDYQKHPSIKAPIAI